MTGDAIVGNGERERAAEAIDGTEAARALVRSVREPDAGTAERVASAVVGGSLVTLGLRRRSPGGAAAAVAGGWLLYRSALGTGRLSRALGAGGRGRGETGAPADAPEVERTITVGRPADELYPYWREADRLARVVEPFADVVSTGDDRQRWAVRMPTGRTMAWNARIVEDRPGEFLRWESLEDASMPNEGSVRFRPAPGDRGTEVTLRLRFDPPGGALGDAAAERLGFAPDALAGTALRRFKSLAETGEVPTLERNPSARGRGDLV